MRYVKRSSKIIVSLVLVLLIIWVITPQLHFRGAKSITPKADVVTNNTTMQPQGEDEFDKYEKPAYFSLFRFISGFLPVKSKKEVSYHPSSNLTPVVNSPSLIVVSHGA